MATLVKKTNLKYKEIRLEPIWVIFDNKLSPPILPLLFTTYLSIYGVVFKREELFDLDSRNYRNIFIDRLVNDKTIRTYVYCLNKYLSYLDWCHSQNKTPSVHSSSSCSNKFISHYINSVLPETLNASSSIEVHTSAIISYYNFLSYLGFRSEITVKIHRKTRHKVSSKSNKEFYIKYISKRSRNELLKGCNSLCEKLIIRVGYEVGLRTADLLGITVTGKNSILTLFDKLNDNKFINTNSFKYLLEGKHTKGGRTRWVYFDRSLLEDMKRYYFTERKSVEKISGKKCDCLFIRTDKRFMGTSISSSHGTRVFKRRATELGFNSNLSYHDLRHTFATELFHTLLLNNEGRETRSESAALIVVAQRLGHKMGREGNAPSTTTQYIRMNIQRREIEEGWDD